MEEAAQHFQGTTDSAIFLGGHPMAGKELSGIAAADEELFRGHTYALIAEGDAIATPTASEPRIAAFVKILEKIGAQPLWIGAQQHDYAVGLASHLPQLAVVALAAFLYDRLDENGLPITLAGPGLRDSLRLAGSAYSTWRDIVLTNQEVLSAALDLLPAAWTNFAKSLPLASLRVTLTRPTNSTNSCAACRRDAFTLLRWMQ